MLSNGAGGSASAFRDKFSFYLGMELRRQGIAAVQEWQQLIEKRVQLREGGLARHADDVPGFSGGDDDRGVTFSLDLDGQQAGDKVVIALCEVLLRLSSPSAEVQLMNVVGEWQLRLSGNALTANSAPHLGMLAQSCPRLTVLDLRHNAFPAAALQELLSLAGETPCDVLLDGGAPARRDRAPSLPAAVGAPSTSDEPEAQKPPEAQPSPPSPPAEEAPASVGARSRRSPSTHTITSSRATTARSFAGGSNEALMRRRAELFGSKAKAPELVAPPAAAAAAVPTTSHEEDSPAAATAGKNSAGPSGDRPSEPIPLFVSPLLAHAAQSTERQRSGEAAVGGLRLSDDNRAADLQQRRAPSDDLNGDASESVGEGTPDRLQPRRAAQPHDERRAPDSEERHGDRNSETDSGDDKDARAAAAREPFTPDRQDELDVTANLHTMLDNVLDLSAVTEEGGGGDGDGRLRGALGAARTVWDVLRAYNVALGQTRAHSAVSSEVSMYLPASLLSGGRCQVLTVLNLSHNGLTSLRVLPETLVRLDVSNNRLVRLSGLERCRTLAVLNARRNTLDRISGLEGNACLAHLFLGHNRIRVVEGLAHLLLLETLDLTCNQLRTEGSIRALSLCSALNHLLLKGNPVMDELRRRGTHRPVLRNLCPTLVVIDDEKLSASRFSEARQRDHNRLRQPHRIDSTQLPAGGGGGFRGGGGGDSAVDASAVSEEEAQSINLLHLMTRGITAPTGYGNMANAVNATRNMSQHLETTKQAAAKKKRQQTTLGGKQFRAEMVKRLAEESKSYLEQTLVERMVSLQQRHSPASGGDGGGGYGNAGTHATTTTRASPEHSREDEILARYKPQTVATTQRPTARPGGPSISPRTTNAARIRREMSRNAVRSRDPSAHRGGTENAVAAAPPQPRRSTSRSGSRHVDPAGQPFSSSSYAALHRPRSSSRAGRTGAAGPSTAFAEPTVSPIRHAEKRPGKVAAATQAVTTEGSRGRQPPFSSTDTSQSQLLRDVRGLDVAGECTRGGSRSGSRARAAPAVSGGTRELRGVGGAQREEVRRWGEGLQRDSEAVQAALRTVVALVEAQRPRRLEVPHSSDELPRTYLQERERCAEMIESGGTVADVSVPVPVMLYYGLQREELSSDAPPSAPPGLSGSDAKERQEVLAKVHLLADAKTCLRYFLVLMRNGDERKLQEYATQVKQSL